MKKIHQQKHEKAMVVKEKLERAQGTILYDYRGLTVEQDTELRREFHKVGVEYHVIKNSLIERAAEELGYKDDLKPYLSGPTALVFGYDDPVAPAKVLSTYINKVKKTEIKSGVLEGHVIDAAGVKRLSDLPSREVLLGKMMGSMKSPISGMVNVMMGNISGLVRVLNAMREQKEQQA